tara:strand:- start:458 stop:673 length:216 start_codon:yes stop_codon:yes gene_type:complete
MITIKRISASQANEKLQQGGLNWILFHGDDFDAGLFEEWCDYAPTDEDVDLVSAAICDLDGDQALELSHEA